MMEGNYEKGDVVYDSSLDYLGIVFAIDEWNCFYDVGINVSICDGFNSPTLHLISKGDFK